ncbi:hypothetical protein C2E23DRAFT_818892 [Lenzites betulinus]|nr:hypothetical protein C2E23DRAFT_818892 [Lenzites betulinus]
MSFGLEREVSPQQALERSMGAVLLGSLVALFLSGAVNMQVFLYAQLYPKDRLRLKIMVFVIWLLDTVHSVMAMLANWQYLIVHFGEWDNMDNITWSVAATVALTAFATFLVHCFFTHRIHTLSRHNWYITTPLVALALVRLISALISTSEMVRLHSFREFVDRYDYVFTLGLSTAASLDVLIAAGLCYFLRRGRSGFTSMDKIVDAITLYTIENGMLTCVTTVISLVCWLTMPTNLIFLGLHFAISKLYANSLLATLNARKSLLNKSQGSSAEREHHLPVIFPDSFARRTEFGTTWSRHRSHGEPAVGLQVNIQKSTRIQHDSDGEPSSAYPLEPNSPTHTARSDFDRHTGESVLKSPSPTFSPRE